MRLTERLNVEHGVLLRQLQHLRGLIREGEPRRSLVAAARVVATALSAHDDLEDRLLYPLLERTFGPAYPPLAAAAEQHGLIAMSLEHIAAGRFDDAELEGFIEMLTAHIEHEVHVVFPLADAWIEPDVLAKLGNWNEEHVTERGSAAMEGTSWERAAEPRS